MTMFDELWAMRLKPKLDTNMDSAMKAWEGLMDVYSEEQVVQTYIGYKTAFLDSGEDERYAKNLTKWLANPADDDCFQQLIRARSLGSEGGREGYRPSTFKISKGLVVDSCYLGRILLGWYQPAERDEWLGICTGEEKGHPSWQPVPWKMADRYIAAGLVQEAAIEQVDWLDRRVGKTWGDVFQVVKLKEAM